MRKEDEKLKYYFGTFILIVLFSSLIKSVVIILQYLGPLFLIIGIILILYCRKSRNKYCISLGWKIIFIGTIIIFIGFGVFWFYEKTEIGKIFINVSKEFIKNLKL